MTLTKQKITAMTNFGHSPLSQAKKTHYVLEAGYVSVFSHKYDNIPLSEFFKTRKIIFTSDLLSKCLIWQYFILCFKKKSLLLHITSKD